MIMVSGLFERVPILYPEFDQPYVLEVTSRF